MTNHKLTSKLARRALIFEEYEFKVIHRPSITHQNANTMLRARASTPQSAVSQGACPDSLLFRCLQSKLTFESIKVPGGASLYVVFGGGSL